MFESKYGLANEKDISALFKSRKEKLDREIAFGIDRGDKSDPNRIKI